MAAVLDTTRNCAPIALCLKGQGYGTVIRYYSRSAWKRLTQEEAIGLGRRGLRIAAVYQDRQNQAADFGPAAGEAAGRNADDYARNVIFQPPGSALYFSVDFDATEAEIKAKVIPYFKGVRQALAAAGGGVSGYRIGVYGSGLTCRLVGDGGHADLTWLAQSTGWAGYQKYLNGGKWHLKQNMPTEVCGIECDPDETNPALPDFGAFLLDPDSLGPAAPPLGPAGADRFRVIARDGLRLRAGPSTQFDIRSVVPFDTTLSVLSRSGDWALVDLDGDGAADGFCHSDFLREA